MAGARVTGPCRGRQTPHARVFEQPHQVPIRSPHPQQHASQRRGGHLERLCQVRRIARGVEDQLEAGWEGVELVSHHSHPRCTIESEEEQDRLLELADARLRVCLDAGISLFMDEDLLAQVDKYAARLGYVHLKDWARGKYCVLGQGTRGFDWGALLARFSEIGYRGWVTVELSTYADTPGDESCRATREYLRSLGY